MHSTGFHFRRRSLKAVHWIIIILLITSLLPASVSTAASLSSGKVKATWLWNTSEISTLEGRNTVIQFAKQQQVNRIYLQINPGVAKSTYRTFIKAAGSAGIQIHALDGAADWIKPDQRQHITAVVKWVKDYNLSVTAKERFTGIQLDIEPYVLPEWNLDRNTTVKNWLDAMVLFVDEAHKSSALSTSAAVPFWLDEIYLPDNGGTLFEALLKHLDEVTLMSYRDQAQALVEIAASKLTIGDRLGKKVFAAVETNQTSEPSFITFYEEGKAVMDQQLALIDSQLRTHASYAGIAVHDYNGWRNLKP